MDLYRADMELSWADMDTFRPHMDFFGLGQDSSAQEFGLRKLIWEHRPGKKHKIGVRSLAGWLTQQLRGYAQEVV